MNRHEIYAVLKERRPDPPSPSSLYRSLRRGGLNRLDVKMVEEKRRIVRTKAGELGHADLHRLSRAMVLDPPQGDAHLVAIVCSCTRLAWAEVVMGNKALAVMLRALKAINTLNARYGLRFEEMLTDNGAEFAGRAKPAEPPFEAMLLELGVRHRYTHPYRPQTNGKVERFWRSLEDDLVDGAAFNNLARFSDELLGSLISYNEARLHPIRGLTPKAFDQSLSNHETKLRDQRIRTTAARRIDRRNGQ
jgi:transposase InsO family protein